MWWMGLVQAGMGVAQTAISAAKAGSLPDNKPFTVGSELRGAFNEAKSRSNEGYSATERAAFEQQLARQGTAAKQMFRNMGMAGAGSAAANIMGTDALNQFAAQGAGIRRQNFGQYLSAANQIQGVQNQETQRHNTQLNMERQALGGAMQSGIGNIMGGINTGVNANQFKQAAGIYGGIANQVGGSYAGGPQVPGLGGGGGSQMSGPYSPYTFEGGGVPFQYAGQQSMPQFGGGGAPQSQGSFDWLNSGPIAPDYNTLWGSPR